MKRSFKHTIALFRWFVIFMFVMIMTLLIVLSSNVYEKVNSSMDDNSVIRTALGYITNKEREYGLKLSEEDNILLYETKIDGSIYIDRIYYDGTHLKEAFLPQDYEFSYGEGEIITELDGFEINKEGQSIEITVTQGKNTMTKKLVED